MHRKHSGSKRWCQTLWTKDCRIYVQLLSCLSWLVICMYADATISPQCKEFLAMWFNAHWGWSGCQHVSIYTSRPCLQCWIFFSLSLFSPCALVCHTPVNVSEFRPALSSLLLHHDWIEVLTEPGSTVGFAYYNWAHLVFVLTEVGSSFDTYILHLTKSGEGSNSPSGAWSQYIKDRGGSTFLFSAKGHWCWEGSGNHHRWVLQGCIQGASSWVRCWGQPVDELKAWGKCWIDIDGNVHRCIHL